MPKLTSRGSRGLKALSIRVRDIVKDKFQTSYKEVADIMIQELDIMSRPDPEKNEKNIRRRVYDALNVLIATGIVAKKSRYVYWGSPPKVSPNQQNGVD
mmetsp:Transcript_12916/g.1976  ORF Transcript_12916/g.1976 Transcript_12916/m.1976 type:complete len:99 (-) Transcript_12916:277-573(-)|eukprot:CAMPEP_0168314362 /NCGR_PEP_ID=MMETSP0210-20121227/7291_1 /TAXON_ID=40633 /ORGANISM="Condylostoma magnum, Strain COL2" /LENGTH=98 /DNA_ID=CAMNT_0008280695 /DNA_START=339 /DNA_END=635 /DNA_ORIENTATION=-